MSIGYEPVGIPKEGKPQIHRELSDIVKDLQGYEGNCLFVIDSDGKFCGEPVSNNCHVVPRAEVLDNMKDPSTGQITELDWGVSQWLPFLQRDEAPTSVAMRSVSPYDACVGWFACKLHNHDDEFNPIDKARPNFKDPVVRFLAAYRIAMFQADQYRQAIHLQGLKEQREQEQGNRAARRKINLGKEWKQETRKLNKARQRAETNVKLLGRNWHSRKTSGEFNPNLVFEEVVTFRSKVHLAGCVILSRASGICVFPIENDVHEMAILCWTGGSGGAQVEGIVKAAKASEESGDYGIDVVKELMKDTWFTLAASPMTFDELSDEDRTTIVELVAKPARVIQRRASAVRKWVGGQRP